MFFRQILSVLIMELGKSLIFDCLYANDLWIAIMEGRRIHELGQNLVPLGTIEIHGLEREICPIRFTFWVPAPARMRISKVLTTTILCDKLGAFLLR